MELPVEALRPIPSVAVMPIALIALGFGYRLEIVIVAFACFWPILILTRAAVAGVEPRLMEVARALRLTPAQRTLKIIVPAALPRIFVAFRLAAGIALIVAVTVEIAINPQGLGYQVMTAGQALRPDLMLAYVVLDRRRRLRAQRAADRGAASSVRTGGAERDSAMSATAWRVGVFSCWSRSSLLWGEIAALKLVSPVFLPTPRAPGLRLSHGFRAGDLWRNSMGTIGHMLDGWLVASLLGVAHRRADRILARGARTISRRRWNSCGRCRPRRSSRSRSRCSD